MGFRSGPGASPTPKAPSPRSQGSRAAPSAPSPTGPATPGCMRASTLEVETRGFKGPRTYEASGIRLHDDGKSVIKERIHLHKANKDVLYDEITVIDNALTRPWAVTKKYIRETSPNIIWHFNDCAE